MTLDGRDPAEIADEYVLGLLEPGEAAEAERLMARDAALAALVAKARERLLEIDVTAAPAEPSDDLWGRIERRLDGSGEADGRRQRRSPSAGLLRRAARPRPGAWQIAAAALIAVGLVALGALGGRLAGLPDPAVVAVLLNDAGEPFALIEGQADNTTRVTILAGAEVPETRVLQVWTKPDPAGDPVSLGLLERAASATVAAEGLPPPVADQLYEITLEAAGGSPTGLPTGPILGKGLAATPR